MSRIELITTDDGSNSIYVPHLKETYHSFHGAVQESRHVFIKHGLGHHFEKYNKRPIHILEIGMGTGLNVLLVVEWATLHKRPVVIETLEAYPIDETIALNLNYDGFIPHKNASAWLSEIHMSPWGEELAIGDYVTLKKVETKLELHSLREKKHDVVFFDAFAPNKQAELWEYAILEKVYKSMASSSVFVTYCAKGQLKRDLRTIGFAVETLEGPPGKKEMVRAYTP